MKKYEEIITAGSIDLVINDLLAYKFANKLVCTNFNGHMLYSDKVTVDGVYMELFGVTKAEADRQRQEEREKFKKELKEYEAQIPTLTKKWIEEGHNILDEKYWAKWDKCVPIHLKGTYKDKPLKWCLNTIKLLNKNCSLNEVIDEEVETGYFLSLIGSMLMDFCDRGKEFVKYIETKYNI